MFNLSDKDLDRLSQEAAQQHEPGDIVGPRLWEKLEARLDRDLGKVNPNPARGIRRLPFYYAPALLVILGVSYYLVRLNNKSHKGTSSGSPPLTMVQPAPAEPLKSTPSSQNAVSDKTNSTPTAPSNTVQYPGAPGASPSNAPATSVRPDASTQPNAPAQPDGSAHPATSGQADAAGRPASPDANTSLTTTTNSSTSSRRRRHHDHLAESPGSPTIASQPPAASASHNSTSPFPGNPSSVGNPPSSGSLSGKPSSPGSPSGKPSSSGNPSGTQSSPGTQSPSGVTRTPRDLTYSAVRKPVRIANAGVIDDSALRHFDLSSIHKPINRTLHINRSLEIGVMGGPDYASVHSISGDRPGSTIGVTVDYQFTNHWYLGSGLLLTRKNFSAVPQDYHVSADFYRQNGMGMGGGPQYIKGAFNMLEVPLNLRYDFSPGGNSLLFASVGASSYFFTTENCGYYLSPYNQPNLICKQYSYSNQPSELFASLNLSIGLEWGISNNFSMVVAPYAKIPTRGIGVGQVQFSSVGVSLALRFAPVLSRKR